METMLLDGMTAAKVQKSLPPLASLYELSQFFDALSDVTRLKIVSALCVSAMCVTDLSRLTELNQTTVSHQLRVLRAARIVSCTRQGKALFYSITPKITGVLNSAVGAVMD